MDISTSLNAFVLCLDGQTFPTDFYSLRKDVEAISQRVEEIRASAGLEQLGEELAKLETLASSDSFWDDRSSAQQTLMALTDIKDKMNLLKEFQSQVFSYPIKCYVYSFATYFSISLATLGLSMDWVLILNRSIYL